MYEMISGGVAMGCLLAGLFFLKFWRQTRDRLFQIFAFSFWILALERITPVVMGVVDEPSTFIYVIRFVAFGLILGAIIWKNKTSNST